MWAQLPNHLFSQMLSRENTVNLLTNQVLQEQDSLLSKFQLMSTFYTEIMTYSGKIKIILPEKGNNSVYLP